MIDILKVTLLANLAISRANFFSNDSSLINFLLQNCLIITNSYFRWEMEGMLRILLIISSPLAFILFILTRIAPKFSS